MDRVIVLGSGFVGRAVASALEAAGDIEVLRMGTSSNPVLAGKDAAATEQLRDVITTSGVRAVINTAGRLRGSDEELHDANVAWPTWLATEALSELDVRLVHLGSAAEYGDPGSARPVPENAEPHPQGAYGETKWAGSSAVLGARAGGLDAVVARGFNLVGADLAPVSPLHQFLTDIAALPPHGGTIDVWYPATVRDFILTDDLAEALCRLALLDEVPDIVNLCAGAAITFEEIVQAMADRAGVPVEIRSLERPGILAVVGDNSRLQEHCDLTPQMSAELIARRAAL